MISYIVTTTSLTAVINGKEYTVARDNPSYNEIKKGIAEGADEATLEPLFDAAVAVKSYTAGKIEVRDGALYYEGEQVHNLVVDRIFDFMSEGLPHEPLLRFIERLMANPSRRSIEELYRFLEHKHMPITEDGCFLGYKGVTEDYKDVHTRSFDNTPGTINQMPRQKVDDDFRNGCSYGFHVGSLEYATGFGPRCVIVKVDPADVVSVPECSNCQKLRTAKYEVICDYQGALERNLYKAQPRTNVYDESFDEVDVDDDADGLDDYEAGYEAGRQAVLRAAQNA